MVEYNINVSTVRGRITYDPIATLDPAALQVLSATQAQDYTDEIAPWHAPLGVVDHFSKDVVGLYIPGDSLPLGTKWLLRYDGSMGAANDKTVVRAYLIDNRNLGTPRALAVSGCEGPYGSLDNDGDTVENDADLFPNIPHPSRNCSCGGWIVYTANGSDLEFSFINQSGGGVACYWRGFQITAIPLDSFNSSDYGYASAVPDFNFSTAHGTSGTGFSELRTLSYTAPQTDDYLVVACGGAGAINANTAECEYRLMENDVAMEGQTWKHQIADTRDSIPVNLSYIRQYTSGQNITIRFDGKASDVTTFYETRNPRVLVFRIGALQRKVWARRQSGSITPITAVYPNWQTVVQLPITPTGTTGEYVMAYARLMLWRTDPGTVLMRIRILETGQVISGYVPAPNTRGTDFDRHDLSCCVFKLTNTTYTYQLQICLAANGTGLTGSYQDGILLVVGLTETSGGANTYNVTIGDETTSNSDSLVGTVGGGGGNVYNTGITDEAPQENANSNVVTIHQPGVPPTIPSVHPRLWFYNNDRLAYLRTRTGSSQYAYMLTKMTSNGLRESWQFALKWKVTQAAADLTAALNRLDQVLAQFDTSAGAYDMLDAGNGTGDGLSLHQCCRTLALFYDWMYNDAGVDQLGATRRARTRNAMLLCVKTIMNPNSEVFGASGWALDNHYNNHSFQQVTGVAYVAMVLHGEAPTTSYQFPWGGTTYQFSIPYENDGIVDSSGFSGPTIQYSDLWQWLQDVVTNKQLPAIDDLDGYSDEGNTYGRGSVHRALELYSLLKNTAGINYIDSHPAFKKMGEFHLYIDQPGHYYQTNLGDHPSSNSFAFTEGGDRMISLFIADTIDSFPVREYQQYWMNHFWPHPDIDDSMYAAFDFLLYRHDRVEINYTTQLPTHAVFTGVGLWSSRDTWADNAVCVSMTGGYRHEEKHHSDFGALQIYRGTGSTPSYTDWLLIDATMRSGNGLGAGNKDDWAAHWHSGPRIATSTMPNGWPQNRYRGAAQTQVTVNSNIKLATHPHLFDIYRSSNSVDAVVFLHGGLGTKYHSAYQLGVKLNDNDTDYVIGGNADTYIVGEQTMLVFPQGQALPATPQARTWSNRVMDSGVDDMAFLSDLVAYLRGTLGMTKVYLAGHSMGGCMTNRVWMEDWDLFDGYIGIAGPPSQYYMSNPSVDSAKPYLCIMGSADGAIQNADWEAETWTLNQVLIGGGTAWVDPIVCGERAFIQERADRTCAGVDPGGGGTLANNITTWGMCDGSFQIKRIEGAGHPIASLEGFAGRPLLNLIFNFINAEA